MEQLALIGPTASGKTRLAIEAAQKLNAYILSLDSLAVFREVDIASAKPTPHERSGIRHFGIDELYVDEYFSVDVFVELYRRALEACEKDEKNLIIVGGTSFYLKILLEGISPVPQLSPQATMKLRTLMQDVGEAYRFLYAVDPEYAEKIDKNDRYRIEKALAIALATNTAPSQWFVKYPPKSLLKGSVRLYEIDVARDTLRKRVSQRTQEMIHNGLIDEVSYLEAKYTRRPHPMKAIGIKETLAFLDGYIDKRQLEEQIVTHTMQLAKRQASFNKSQFRNVERRSLEALRTLLIGD